MTQKVRMNFEPYLTSIKSLVVEIFLNVYNGYQTAKMI